MTTPTRWDLTFSERGELFPTDRSQFLDQATDPATDVDDLVFFAHGWNTSLPDARSHCDQLFPLIQHEFESRPGIGTVGFVGVFWPALWFPDTPASPPPAGGAAQSGTAVTSGPAAGTGAVPAATITASLAAGFADPKARATLAELGTLIDDGYAEAGEATDVARAARLAEIRSLIVSLIPPAPADGEPEDQGEAVVLLRSASATGYATLARIFGSSVSAAATAAVDPSTGVLDGAKEALRILSFGTMKARAGTIGSSGLGPLLAELHARKPALRVHLVGHSFGARLVSFALAGIPAADQSPVAALTLLQGAFSHWSFATAEANPFGEAGTLNGLADRVRGALVATFSPFDRAVGIWYPKASLLAHEDVDAESTDRWGGLGSDGFQAVSPALDCVADADGNTDKAFVAGTFHRVDAAAVIKDVTHDPFAGAHSDIYHPAIARLIAAAAAAHE